MRHLIGTGTLAMALLVGGCVGAGSPPAGPTASPAPSVSPLGETTIPRCEDVPPISAPAEQYRDDPIYVANEQPLERVHAWASSQPGFEEIWIDREHRGWITLAFSRDAEQRQAELAERFPDVGVVVVAVGWTMAELESLQQRVVSALSQRSKAFSAAILPTHGVVAVGVGVMTPERLAELELLFAGEPVCVEGIDPADAPSPGPQTQTGDGWRLLADEPGAGATYRTGIATDQASYERLWASIGLEGDRPAVDFTTEVVIWFGAVYGSSCPGLRLEDVVVDAERALVHAQIVLVDPPPVCTSDANPRAYLVSVARAKLPERPFAIQLGADDPPPGAPEERTVVEVDLSRPGAVAGPGEVHPDTSLPEPLVIMTGAIIEPGFEYTYDLLVHCGTEWLGFVNDVAWRTDVHDEPDYVPPEWRPLVQDGLSLQVSIVLRTAPEPLIEATAAGHTVVYRPSPGDPPGCD